jgi:ABC-type nickel/cobalt efflux system permease component RcnA
MRFARFPLVVATLVLAARVADAASPFGIATPDSPSPVGFGGPLAPLFMEVAYYQSVFYKGLTHALSDIRNNGWAVWLLLALSFAYGIFHAAGPGHGKAVISAYLVSSGETVKRGVALSFLAAFVQAVSAVLLVGIAAMILHVTAVTMTAATDWFEILSYALIAAVGAWLLWAKTFGGDHHHHVIADTSGNHGPALEHAHHLPEHYYGHEHHHDHSHDHEAHHHAHEEHEHHHDAGRASARSPLARAWAAVLSVGVRPCSGAIIVLVFALSQGLFLAGVAATFVMAIGTGLTVAALATLAVAARNVAVRFSASESPAAARAIRLAEIAAAAGVLVFGLLLLGGALVSGLPGSGG